MAEIAAVIANAPELNALRKKQSAWALNLVSRACGGTSHTVIASPKTIAENLAKFEPAMLRIAPTTFRNALALTRFALRYAGVIQVPPRRRVPFAPAWTELIGLADMKEGRIGLSSFARYCSAHGIVPDQVDDSTFDGFLAELSYQDISPNARRTHRRAILIWNRFADTKRGWPNQTIKVPSYSKRFALDWKVLPDTLIADVDAHLHHLTGGDALTCLDVKPLKASSIKTRRHQIHALISGTVLSGVESSSLRTLADVVAVPAVRRGLLYLLGRSKKGSKAQAHDVCRTMVSIAKHWVKVPEAHLAELQAFSKRLNPGDEGMSAKNKERLRQFDDPANVRKLLWLPDKLVRKARQCESRPTVADALLVQSALVIEIELMIPIRRHNMAALNINKHFLRQSNGTVLLIIDGEEVKNGVDVDAELPRHVVKLLDIYLRTYRPLLAREPSDWLIPGIADRHKSLERLGLQISATVKRETGLLVNLHLFRHIDAKLYLDQNPGGYGVVQRLEGHRSPATTLKVYSGMERRSAVAHYDQTILKLRGKAGVGTER